MVHVSFGSVATAPPAAGFPSGDGNAVPLAWQSAAVHVGRRCRILVVVMMLAAAPTILGPLSQLSTPFQVQGADLELVSIATNGIDLGFHASQPPLEVNNGGKQRCQHNCDKLLILSLSQNIICSLSASRTAPGISMGQQFTAILLSLFHWLSLPDQFNIGSGIKSHGVTCALCAFNSLSEICQQLHFNAPMYSMKVPINVLTKAKRISPKTNVCFCTPQQDETQDE